MRYPDYNTQSVWKRIDQMLTEHFVNNPQDCKDSEIVAESLFNESQYQKWLKKPIHTFGTEVAFDMFNEAINRAVCLVKNNYNAVDYNRINSKSDWEVDPVSINESAYFAPEDDFFTGGVTNAIGGATKNIASNTGKAVKHIGKTTLNTVKNIGTETVKNAASGTVKGVLDGAKNGAQLTKGPWGAVLGGIAGGIAGGAWGSVKGVAKGTFKSVKDEFNNVNDVDDQVVDTSKPIVNTVGDTLTDFFECEETSDKLWYQEQEENISIKDIFNFQNKNNMKYIEATGIFDNNKSNNLKIRINKGSSHCSQGSSDFELGISDGKKVEYFLDYEVEINVNSEDGDIELTHKANKENNLYFKLLINEPIINITDEDELEPPGSGSFL